MQRQISQTEIFKEIYKKTVFMATSLLNAHIWSFYNPQKQKQKEK